MGQHYVIPSEGGYALDFDDGGSYVTTPFNQVFNFSKTSQFSVEFWAKPTIVNGIQKHVISKCANNQSRVGGFFIRITNTGNGIIDHRLISTGAINKWREWRWNPTMDVWYHFLFTYDGSDAAAGLALYINGVVQSPTLTTNNAFGAEDITSSQALTVGDTQGGATDGFRGHIDAVRIYQAALGPVEAVYLYNLGFGRYKGLSPVVEFHFDEGEGTTTEDSSGNNLVGTMGFIPGSANPQWVTGRVVKI